MTAKEVIYLKDIQKAYFDQQVLKTITLRVLQGDFISIVGKSGAGKTTLLNVLGLLDDYDSGDYAVETIAVNNLGKHHIAKIRNETFGYIFQMYHLISGMSVKENVILPTLYRKSISRKDAMKKAEILLQKFNMFPHADKDISKLSGGEMQRVALSRALINSPDIILADEPTGNLDKENAEAILRHLQTLNDNGKTIILVTHDERVASIAKRRFVLEEGVLVNA